ncbi:MAG TPA: ATP-dependent sacrificial sulfur transferase LarE, partial [Polyangiaceae bacterium]|nr:ATP-dependent sacrificial sulfur transferase LarE [Polyangiaceae bacterium]
MTQSESTHVQLARLRALLRDMGSVLVCYSGGIDSALVLAVAHQELGVERAVALTAVSPSLPQREREAAAAFARSLGANHQLVASQEIQRPDYVKNAPDRCFHCKTELYQIAQAKAEQWGLSTVVNGTNCDDLGDYRPGLHAAELAQVRSPLCEAGLTKRDVRALAQLLELDLWDKPASACLASRIPYGTQVTPARLQQIEALESTLQALGFAQVRV